MVEYCFIYLSGTRITCITSYKRKGKSETVVYLHQKLICSVCRQYWLGNVFVRLNNMRKVLLGARYLRSSRYCLLCVDLVHSILFSNLFIFQTQMSIISSITDLLPGTSVVLVFLVVLLLSTWLLLSRRNLPPGPWGHPLFGHILDIQRSTDYYRTLLEYR